mmetsp:Transcript_18638/g.56304  ORF Transcript_18638/g.56304 Transcript_18638/m.56304 type:complete len:229 (+) Transcript_18638:1430-2116(+)
MAPLTTDASSSAAVLCRWMYCNVDRPTLSAWPSDLMSTTWPATRPSEPTAFPVSTITLSTRAGSTPFVSRAMYSKDRLSSASPARMAMSSPYFLWLVGTPRRKSSLSMLGRSSWMSDMVWIISMAQAAGMAHSTVPPTSSAAARHSAGRTRLPPASNEYRIDSFTSSGYCMGTDLSRAWSMSSARCFMYCLKSNASAPSPEGAAPPSRACCSVCCCCSATRVSAAHLA